MARLLLIPTKFFRILHLQDVFTPSCSTALLQLNKDNLSNELHMVDLPLGFTSSTAVFVADSSSSSSESSSDSTSSAAAYTTGASLTLISTLEIT